MDRSRRDTPVDVADVKLGRASPRLERPTMLEVVGKEEIVADYRKIRRRLSWIAGLSAATLISVWVAHGCL